MSRSRNFCFTLNNYSEADLERLLDVDCKYVVIGKEVGQAKEDGTPGTPHLQGYFSFNLQKTLAACKKVDPRAHWEICKGLPSQNRAYCIKQGDFQEKGKIPADPSEKGEGEKRRWEDAFAAVKENRIEDVPADIKCRHLKSIEYAVTREADSMRKLSNLEFSSNEWRWGDPKSGKSEGARLENPDHYVKLVRSKWFDNYKHEPCVIIEDIDPESAKSAQFLKTLADIYPLPVEVKGGTMMIRPKRIIVTSNYHPSDIFSGVDLEAILRRFLVLHFVHDPNFHNK